MALYILKPIFWNTNQYHGPSGIKATTGFPKKHGYGHEEWNNSPRMGFDDAAIIGRATVVM